MEIEMIIAIVVFVLTWIWCIWEALNSPVMPNDYNEEGISKDYSSAEEEMRDE
jgi:hypothetical protein|tara:strand:- start:601 stop:759 length:159 start_codon:yes stop_codon:yes gene_type:complete